MSCVRCVSSPSGKSSGTTSPQTLFESTVRSRYDSRRLFRERYATQIQLEHRVEMRRRENGMEERKKRGGKGGRGRTMTLTRTHSERDRRWKQTWEANLILAPPLKIQKGVGDSLPLYTLNFRQLKNASEPFATRGD